MASYRRGWPISAAAAAVWFAAGLWRAWQLAAGWQATLGYRIAADGSIERLLPGLRSAPATLLPGSVLLPRLAWLIVRSNGRVSVDLLRGGCRESAEWRRFQVICRHLTTC